MAVRSLIVALEARTQAFESALNRTDRHVANFERTVQKVQRVLAFAATAGGLYVATKKLFELGSSVEETRNKFETTFGAATESVTRFGQEFSRMAGLSQRTFQDLAATTGAVVQGMGFAEQASAAFAQQVLRLSGDLASFNNLETADVAQRITTALTGERESMKRLGIVVQETEVQQRAMANTGKTVAAQLTQQEKATATLELITQKAGKAVGDLARTQDSAANRAKQLKAEFQTIAEDFATKMLPAIAAMLPALNALIPPLARLVELSGQFVSGLALTSPRIASQKEVMDRIAAERASFAGLGDRALPGARARYNQEIQRLTGQLGGLPASYFDGPNTIVNNLVAEIQAYGQLIAQINARLTAAATSATAIATSASAGLRPLNQRIGDRADAFAAPRLLTPNIGAFGPSVGPGSPYAFRGTTAGAPTQEIDTLGWALNDIADASITTTKAVNDLNGAMTVGIASIGAMAQAVIHGSASMEQAIISAMTQIAQAIIQLQAAQLGSLAGPLGAIVGAFGGFFGAIFGGGGSQPQPVVVQDVSDTAADKLERRRTGPDRVILYVADRAGNIQQTVDLLNRATQRDAVPRLAGTA